MIEVYEAKRYFYTDGDGPLMGVVSESERFGDKHAGGVLTMHLRLVPDWTRTSDMSDIPLSIENITELIHLLERMADYYEEKTGPR